MRWSLSHRADTAVVPLADRHYSRQTIGAPQFVPPGRCLVLRANSADGKTRGYWVTSWPFTKFTHHAWAGAWICSAFRNEGAGLSSELITEAVSATRQFFGSPPPLGMITFVDASKVRQKRDHGYCYILAGFRRAACPEHCLSADMCREEPGCAACDSRTKSGLLVFQMLPEEMPRAQYARGSSIDLFPGGRHAKHI